MAIINWLVNFFPLRFYSKLFICVIWSMIGYLFAHLLLEELPALRFSLSKNRVCLKDHSPIFLLVRFAWLPCLVSYFWYSISQSARCFSGTAAAFQNTKAYRPASLKCASRGSAQPINSSLNFSLRSALQSGQVTHPTPDLTALSSSASLFSHSLRSYPSRLLVCAPRLVAWREADQSPRPAAASMPCGAQQTSSPVRLFAHFRASNPRAKACLSAVRHRRKSGIVRAFYFKVDFIFLLAGIHQLLISKFSNRLASPSPLPIPQTPNPTPQTHGGKLNMGDRVVGLGLCAMRPPVSLVATKLSPLFARFRPERAQKSFCASRVLVGLRLFSLCRLLRCPFGNTPNKLLLVNSLKGC